MRRVLTGVAAAAAGATAVVALGSASPGAAHPVQSATSPPAAGHGVASPPPRDVPPAAVPAVVLRASGALTRDASALVANGPQSYDALKAGPRVVRELADGTIEMLYEAVGADRTTTIARATSADGRLWTKRGVVLRPSLDWERDEMSPGSLVTIDGILHLYYHAGGYLEGQTRLGTTAISLATSEDDGRTWVKRARPVLSNGPAGSTDAQQAAEPRVVRVEDGYRMYYTGQSVRGGRTTLNLATSRDGTRWVKRGDGPVVDAGSWGDQWGGAIFYEDGVWLMWRAVQDKGRQGLHFSWSEDGLRWRDGGANPVLRRASDRTAPDGEFLGDSVSGFRTPDGYRILYTGYTSRLSGQGRFEGIVAATLVLRR